MSQGSSSSSSGIGFYGLLTAIFVSAKVFGFEPVASWSWWWVFSPLWIGASIVLGILALGALGVVIWAAVEHCLDQKRAARRRRQLRR